MAKQTHCFTQVRDTKPRHNCPTPHKKHYWNEVEAMWVGTPIGLEAYACQCGLWCLTSKV